MDWALVKVKGDITASAAELTGERSAKTEHFDWKKNVYKWCFWWLVAQSAPCKPNRDFRTILLGFPCRQSPECYFRLEGSKEVFGQQRWFHLLCANCYVVCTEWKDDNWLDLNKFIEIFRTIFGELYTVVHVTVTFKSGMVLCLLLNSRSRWFVHHWENYTSRVFQILSFIYGNGLEIIKVNKVFHLNSILQKKRCQILPTVALVVCWSKHCANVFVLLCLLSTNCHSLLFQKVHVLKQHWRLFMAYSKASVFF